MENFLPDVSKSAIGINEIGDLNELFEKTKYVADSQITMAVFLSLKLGKPLLVEGYPGCGKTEIAKALSEGLGTRLIRLQCYEGLDANSTIYEWDYMRQLVHIKIEEEKKSPDELEQEIFTDRFLLKRPLLDAVLDNGELPPVLLIDEIDRADEEFEGFLLELLAEFQVTVPELGTFRAKHRPIIIITSNHTRELGDGLRRRCLYLYLSYPNFEKELSIVKLKVPGVEEKLAAEVVAAVEKIRNSNEVIRKPGTAETLDWVSALADPGGKTPHSKSSERDFECILKNADETSFYDEERLARLL